ncbi:MAG: hypothetical protein ACRDGD_01660 [Candidatus Limnocylindria bacterium]
MSSAEATSTPRSWCAITCPVVRAFMWAIRRRWAALEAGGHGPYARDEIEDILATACIGFGACRAASGSTTAVVHTGNWGTGAFGGDRALMALLQLVAARLAGLDRLVFHSSDGAAHLRKAEELLDKLPMANGAPIDDLIDAIHAHGFAWGVSDGN